jgi:hypothetical protein
VVGYIPSMVGRCTRGLGALALLAASACTSSENQLFSQLSAAGGAGVGAAGTMAGAGEGGAGGGPDEPDRDSGVPALRNPTLDPDAAFLWTETQPGSGRCEPGTYAGRFECAFEGDGDRIEGSLELTLESATADNELPIDDSRMFTADLIGALACTDMKLSATTTAEQTFPLPTDLPDAGFFGPNFDTTSLSGTLDGDFDGDALEIKGDVTLRSDDATTCSGEFWVRLAR